MRKLTLFVFMLSTICLTAQTNKEVLNLIQIANDSIENGQIEGAKRILEGLSVYDSYTDTIQILNKKMAKKSLSLAYEAYTNRKFDLAQQYYYAVTDSDDVRPYWIDNASKMDTGSKIVGSINLGITTDILSKLKQGLKKKIYKYQYEKLLIAIIEGLKKEQVLRTEATMTVDYLIPFQDPSSRKWGYQDTKGVVLIPAEYDSIKTDFIDGLCVLVKDGIYGYLHYSGFSVFKRDYVNTQFDGNNEIESSFNVDAKLGEGKEDMYKFYVNFQRQYVLE